MMRGVSTAGSADGPVIGYWGDRSGIHPNSNPPVRWDYDTGLNILWHTATPTFGYGAPTVLKDKVVCVTDVDPEHPFPLVIGLDLATGAECWRDEVNPLVLLSDEAKRKEMEELWVATLRWRGDYNRMLRDWNTAPTNDKSQVAESMKNLGLKPEGDVRKRGYPAKEDILDPNLKGSHWTKPWDALGKVGLSGDTWRYHCYGLPGGGWYFGETFATPVSDGERVYVQIAWGVWVAYDASGKRMWIRHLPSLGAGDYCQAGRSPLIWRDYLVADLGDWVRAFDRATGKEVWACQRSKAKVGQHEMSSPLVVTVAGKDYLYANGTPMFAVRLEDGVPCLITGPSSKSPGLIARTDPDRKDVLYLAGGGEHGGWEGKGKSEILSPACLRLKPGTNDTLEAEVLWHGVEGKAYGSQVSPMIAHGGKLYFLDCILDAATGKVRAGEPRGRGGNSQAVPDSSLTLQIAGGRIYGQGYAEHGSEKRNDDLGAAVVCQVFDMDGHYLASNRLRGLSGREAMRVRCNIPNWFNYPNNFTIVGDRIVTRSCDEVICIGRTDRAFSAAEMGRMAPGLAKGPTLDAVVAQLSAKDRCVRLAAVQALAGLKDKAEPVLPKIMEMFKSDSPEAAEMGFLAICALGPSAVSLAPELAKLAVGAVPGRDTFPGKNEQVLPVIGTPAQRVERARQALGALGPGSVETLAAMLGETEGGYGAAMQTAAVMEDLRTAAVVLAHGVVGGKAPRFLPKLHPFATAWGGLTQEEGLPQALLLRAWAGKDAGAILAKALTAGDAKRRFGLLASLVAAFDPVLLEPHVDALRSLVKEKNLSAAQALGGMGPKAASAVPDLEAWRADPKVDPKQASAIDAVLVKIRGPAR
jgi:HEAT repeat protein